MIEQRTSGGATRALHRFAMLAAGATFCLIFVGGLVTSTGSALAVPDWPLAFGMIVVQAVLGGITVLFELPLAIAVTHAATAQAFFCVMVALAIFTNPGWEQTAPADESGTRPPLAALAAITTAAVYGQILVGALM